MKKKVIMAVCAILVIAVGIAFYLNAPAKRLQRQLELAQHYLEDMDYEQAIAAYNLAIEIEPKNVDAYLGLADVYIAQGDMDMAFEILQQGYEITQSEEIKKMMDSINTESGEKEATEDEASGIAADGEEDIIQVDELSDESVNQFNEYDDTAFEQKTYYQPYDELESDVKEIISIIVEDVNSIENMDLLLEKIDKPESTWVKKIESASTYMVLTIYEKYKVKFYYSIHSIADIDIQVEVRPESGQGYSAVIDIGSYSYCQYSVCNCVNWQFQGTCQEFHKDGWSNYDLTTFTDYYLIVGKIKDNYRIGTWNKECFVQNGETCDLYTENEIIYDDSGHKQLIENSWNPYICVVNGAGYADEDALLRDYYW